MRRAFTIAEMLVAIGILTVLIGVALSAYGTSLTTARVQTTRVRMVRVASAVSDQMAQNERRDMSASAERLAMMYARANSQRLSRGLSEAMQRHELHRSTLPSVEADLYGLNGLSDYPSLVGSFVDDSATWVRMFDSTGVPRRDSWIARNVVDHAADSSELLLAALRYAPVDVSDLGDTDGDGNMELIDGWGNPIRFYNWTTRLVRPDGPSEDIWREYHLETHYLLTGGWHVGDRQTLSATQYNHPLNQNPFDFAGLLDDPRVTRAYAMLEPPGVLVRYPAFDETTFCMINTWTAPLLVSAGPDGELGLVEPDGFNPKTKSTQVEMRSALVINRDAIKDNVTP